MADSWQQIDNDGAIMDWTSADTIKLCDLWHPLNAIRRAINERKMACNLTLTTAIDRLASIYDSIVILHNAVTSLITKYANHTDSNGNWDGQSSIPSWSESTIVESAGYQERIAPAKLKDITPWMLQHYKILNLLKWYKREDDPELRSSFVAKSSGHSYVSWGDCESMFVNETWFADPIFIGQAALVYISQAMVNNSTPIRWDKQGIKNTHSYTASHSFVFDVDLYSNLFSRLFAFQPIGKIVEANKWYNNNNLANKTTPISYEYMKNSDFDDSLNDPFGAGSDNSWLYLNEHRFNPIAVFKFDGANGFKFRDW
jgi:hypothetical protein